MRHKKSEAGVLSHSPKVAKMTKIPTMSKATGSFNSRTWSMFSSYFSIYFMNLLEPTLFIMAFITSWQMILIMLAAGGNIGKFNI
jgi:hypothetical protein